MKIDWNNEKPFEFEPLDYLNFTERNGIKVTLIALPKPSNQPDRCLGCYFHDVCDKKKIPMKKYCADIIFTNSGAEAAKSIEEP